MIGLEPNRNYVEDYCYLTSDLGFAKCKAVVGWSPKCLMSMKRVEWRWRAVTPGK